MQCMLKLVCFPLCHGSHLNEARLYLVFMVPVLQPLWQHKQLARIARGRNAGEKLRNHQVWSVFFFFYLSQSNIKKLIPAQIELIVKQCRILAIHKMALLKTVRVTKWPTFSTCFKKECWSKTGGKKTRKKKLPNVDGTRTRKYLSLQQLLKLHNRYALKLYKNGEVVFVSFFTKFSHRPNKW